MALDLVRAFRQAIETRSGVQPNGGGMSISDFDGVLDMLAGGGQPSYTGKLVSPRNAIGVSACWSCVNILSDDWATLPLPVYRWIKPGVSRDEARDHYLWPLFNGEANPRMSSFDFKKIMEAWRNLWGNAYAEIEINGRGQVTALWPWRPDRVKVWQKDRNDPKSPIFYTYLPLDYSAPTITRSQDQILHIKGVTIDGIVGVSPIEAHRQTLGISMAMTEFAGRFYGRGAQLRGIYSHPGKIGVKGEEDRKKWMSEFQGVSNSWKTMILEEGMTYKDVGIPQNDAQYIESMNLNGEDICRIYKVPQHRAGFLERCVPGDAEVYTEEGPRPIVEVRPGDMVWSYDPNSQKIVKSEVSRFWNNGFAKILTIRTTNRTLRCTARHKVLARVRVLEPAMAHVGGYRDSNGDLHRLTWKNAMVEAGELQVGDSIIALNGLPETETTERLPNGRMATVGFMEFCGLLLSDGNILKKSGVPSVVCIARSLTALYMDHYRAVILEEFKKTDGADVYLSEEERNTKFSSRTASDELTMLGLSGTALTKRVPGWVFMLIPDLRLAFLRGFLDGYGTVDKLGRIVYRVINREMLSSLRHLCVGLGIPVTNVQRVNNRRTAYIKGRAVTGKFDLYSFTCSDPGANRRIGSHDPRYTQRFESGKPFSRKGRKYPRFGCLGFEFEGMEISRISGISQSTLEEPVYDLEVSKTHSYVSDSVVVSNSTNNNIEWQGLEYVQYTLGPNAANWVSQAHCWLLSARERDNVFLEPDYSYLLAADHVARAAYYTALANTASISPDEIRHREGYNPLPNKLGQIPRAMVNTAPLGSEIASGDRPNPSAPSVAPNPDEKGKPDKQKTNGMAH